MPNKKILINALTIIGILLIAGIVWLYYPTKTGTANLSWNPNTEDNLAGYKIYYGTIPRTGADPKTCAMCGYSQKIDIGKTNEPSKPGYMIKNLEKSKTYYFSVTSYNKSNIESSFSAEMSKSIK